MATVLRYQRVVKVPEDVDVPVHLTELHVTAGRIVGTFVPDDPKSEFPARVVEVADDPDAKPPSTAATDLFAKYYPAGFADDLILAGGG